MTPLELSAEIQDFCESNVNEAIIKKYSKYFREGYDAYGLTIELLYEKVDEIIKRPSVNFNMLRETAKILVKSLKYEHTSFAIIFYRRFSEDFSKETFTDITVWFETGISNWGHCDVISGDLMFILLGRGIITYKDLAPWLKAKNKFQRRAVPVSLIKILKKEESFEKYFRLIEPLMTDPEREVHQGTGWFLREAWKKRRDETENYLLEWKDLSPRLIFQYACEKMSSEEKLRFKRSK
jgi:3-methyladenine DNA glycosylase AlkD